MTSNNRSTVYVLLGSNIDPEAHLRQAIQLLKQRCTLLAVSHAYRTPPQNFTDQADFLNLAVKMTTALDVSTLKHTVLDWIECELKRVRDRNDKNAPHTIDLDIALWNADVFDYSEKPRHIPHPDIVRYAHVAVPLAEIAPDYLHPTEKVTLGVIAARFANPHFEKIKLL